MDKLRINDKVKGEKAKGNKPGFWRKLLAALFSNPNFLGSAIAPKGLFRIEHLRDGKLIQAYLVPNAVTNEGKNKLWDVMFGGVTQLTGWKIGIIDNTSYSSSPVTDTMSSHSGWIEFTNYSQATRVSWGPDAAANQAMTNTTAATFDITGSGTLKGIFVTSSGTKSGTTGTLWSTALFASTIPVTNGDQIKITYTVSA